MTSSYPLLESIDSPQDLRKLDLVQLPQLASELRDFLVESVSQTSGHLASGLGVVELTIALHYVYDTPNDTLIWDVGHQAYPHKILTGRRTKMQSMRQYGGLHPFLWREESPYDAFSTGHASTSISEALGVAIANRLTKNDHKVVAVLGDGALTGGVAFEAMNHAGALGENMLIILNDNEMSISESVGSLSKHLAVWLSSETYARFVQGGKEVLKKVPKIKDFALRAQEHLKGMVVPGTLFEEFGFNYVGPIDGHDIPTLVEVLSNMRKLSGPQVLHIATKKGKGYKPAEDNPTGYHGVPKFDPQADSLPTPVKKDNECSFSALFGKWLVKQASVNQKLVAITPAMCEGSGMSEFAKQFPERYFDVAIAEQHAILLASGFAVGGLFPVACVYSTFLQRAYDQIIHDIAIQNVPMILAIDRAGIVGPDGPTHQGVFDIAYIRNIPNMVSLAPSSIKVMWQMLNTCLTLGKPVAIRYPRGTGTYDPNELDETCYQIGKAHVVREGQKVCIMVWGTLLYSVQQALEQHQADFTLVDMGSIKPLDTTTIWQMAKLHDYIITLEDGVIAGGIGEEVATIVQEYNVQQHNQCFVHCLGVPDEFVEQGTVTELHKLCSMDGESVVQQAITLANKQYN